MILFFCDLEITLVKKREWCGWEGDFSKYCYALPKEYWEAVEVNPKFSCPIKPKINLNGGRVYVQLSSKTNSQKHSILTVPSRTLKSIIMPAVNLSIYISRLFYCWGEFHMNGNSLVYLIRRDDVAIYILGQSK